MPPLDPDTAAWFEAEVRPLLPMFRAWLRSQFPAARDGDDLVQDAVMRLLRVHATEPVRSPKAYLYVIGRNLALMELRRQTARKTGSLEEIDAWCIPDEGTDVHDAAVRTQELEMLTHAIQALPTRCRQVLTLRKLYGMSQLETARELGIAEHTVEIHTAAGLRKVNRYFQERLQGRDAR